MLDAPGLVEEDYRRSSAGQKFENWKPLPSGVIEFVNEIASGRFQRSQLFTVSVVLNVYSCISGGGQARSPLQSYPSFQTGYGIMRTLTGARDYTKRGRLWVSKYSWKTDIGVHSQEYPSECYFQVRLISNTLTSSINLIPVEMTTTTVNTCIASPSFPKGQIQRLNESGRSQSSPSPWLWASITQAFSSSRLQSPL